MRTEDKQELNEPDASEQNLEACVLALARWQGPLSPELRHKIQEIGKQIPNNDAATGELRNLLVNNGLEESYRTARCELFQKSIVRERFKSPGEIAIPNSDVISEIAAIVSTAEDFAAAVYKLVTHPHWKARVASLSEDEQTFFQLLTDSVVGLDALAIEILTILDRDVYTLSQIAYRTDLPKEQIEPTLEALWQQNYIYPVSKTILGNLWGSLNVFSQRKSRLDVSSYLALTAKGYFYLHPYFKAAAKSMK
ncbi:MAG: hypothetical protein WA885_24120 [Phormidesmis sp.]